MPSLISFYKSINNILNHIITMAGVNNIVKVANNKLQMLNFAKYNINSVAPDLVKFTPITHRLYERKTVYTPFTHPFHIVDPSPWPFCTSIALWFGALNTMAMVHNYVTVNIASGLMALFYLLFSLAGWWRDVIRESTYEFKHTAYVRRGLLLGMMLFIISEVMFFFGFFWAFFSFQFSAIARYWWGMATSYDYGDFTVEIIISQYFIVTIICCNSNNWSSFFSVFTLL